MSRYEKITRAAALFALSMGADVHAASRHAAQPSVKNPRSTKAKASAVSRSKAVVTISGVRKIAPPERGVGSLSKAQVRHVSPNANYQTILKNIAGFNVISAGSGNLTASNSTFTYEGFNSDQVGVNFDGVPIINIFRGGASGTAFDHGITPIAMGQFSGVSVYSGANTPSETGINALGGTIDYHPVMPTTKPYVTLTGQGGVYHGGGDNVAGTVAANSGRLPYSGTMFYGSYTHNPYSGYLDNTYADSNNYYLSALQPYDGGMSQLSFIMLYNTEKSRFPQAVPLALIDRYGSGYQWPTDVATSTSSAQAFTTILGWKSVINDHMVAKAKFFATSGSNDTLSYANAAYRTGYDGYPLPTNLHNISQTPQNTYNPVALFGSGYNGSQYQRYIDNYNSLGFTPSWIIILPSNTVTVGGLVMHGTDLSSNWFYGAPNVPTIDGYNDAWNERDSRTVTDVYAQDRVSLLQNKLLVVPGVKEYVVTSTTVETAGYFYRYPGSVTKTFHFLEPSLGFSYLADKRTDFYVHYGRVYKAPDITAFYSAIGSSPVPSPVATKPEYVDSLDTGIRYKVRGIGLSLAYFRRAFQNTFSTYYDSATGQTFEYNLGSALYQGFTLALHGAVTRKVSWWANYSLTRARYTSDFSGTNGTVTNGMFVGDVPLYGLNAGIDYRSRGFFTRLSDHVVGSQYIENNAGTTTTTALKAYNVTNLDMGYNWRLHTGLAQSIGVEFYVDNLFNAHYIPYEYIQKSGNYALAESGAPMFVGGRLSIKM